MFRSEKQQHLAIRTLLGTLGLDRFWTEDGPTREACDLLGQSGGPMSTGEEIIFRAAFAFWNGHGRADWDDVINRLDTDRYTALVTLGLAVHAGADAVDEWIDRYGRRT